MEAVKNPARTIQVKRNKKTRKSEKQTLKSLIDMYISTYSWAKHRGGWKLVLSDMRKIVISAT